jgi:hypothetical protein
MATKRSGEGNWMLGAVKRPGSLRAAAHRAGESTMEFAREHKHSPGKVGKRARLAITFSKFRKKGHRSGTRG